MKVRAQFFAQLRDAAGTSELEIDLMDGSTAREMLEKLYEKFPALRANDKTILLGVGLEFVDRSYQLQPGDQVAVMPPVQGG